VAQQTLTCSLTPLAWLSIWLQISSNILGCILVYILLHVKLSGISERLSQVARRTNTPLSLHVRVKVGVTSLAEALVWLWVAQMHTTLCLGN
jgi:hypothetical protein